MEPNSLSFQVTSTQHWPQLTTPSSDQAPGVTRPLAPLKLVSDGASLKHCVLNGTSKPSSHTPTNRLITCSHVRLGVTWDDYHRLTTSSSPRPYPQPQKYSTQRGSGNLTTSPYSHEHPARLMNCAYHQGFPHQPLGSRQTQNHMNSIKACFFTLPQEKTPTT